MKKRKNRLLAGLYVLVVIINALAWCGRGFGDMLRQSVFQITQYAQGHTSSLFPFSLGEFLLWLAVFLMAGAVFFLLVLLAGKMSWLRKGAKLERFAVRYLYGMLWVIGIVSIIMSTNCFTLYHCSSFGENYMPEKRQTYKVGELALVRDYVVRQCNELAKKMERDEDGRIVYDGNIEERAIAEMKRLGKAYPLLAGYYPAPKRLAFSGFFSQQYIMGYYFPFSMEANYNGVMYIANVPVTICHELSHVKGFIYEDDANFIGFLACISSDDAFFRYSGYLSVLDYLNGNLYESLGSSMADYLTYERCSSLVEQDNVFLTKEVWAEVESKAVLDTETVKRASHNFLETNLQLNGVEEGVASYGKVVEQLLTYYEGVLY